MKELRERIRDLREDHDLRQTDVAEYLHVAQQVYSKYERGCREIPAWVAGALARYYQVSTDYLLGVAMYYPGNTDLGRFYLDKITLYDLLYDIQKLPPESRKELVRYVSYLKAVSRHESERETRRADEHRQKQSGHKPPAY